MLAYLFWHRPNVWVSRDEYEQRLVDFHAGLVDGGVDSASFRLERLPFADADGYEDWYLARDWEALGALNRAATEGPQARRHDASAELSGEGWGGVYALVRGEPSVPTGVRWASKDRGETYSSFLARQRGISVWQRQLLLGPAPEFCLASEPSPARLRLAPPEPQGAGA